MQAGKTACSVVSSPVPASRYLALFQPWLPAVMGLIWKWKAEIHLFTPNPRLLLVLVFMTPAESITKIDMGRGGVESVSCESEEVEMGHEPASMINPKVAIAETSSPGHFPVSFLPSHILEEKARGLKLKSSNLHLESSGGSLPLPRNGAHSLGTSFFLNI